MRASDESQNEYVELPDEAGCLPLTQDNNYDVIYKQTANYRQTELAG